ncbi:hypothetical protein K2173_017149 [Erythroxylum novogranatense]|uniref:NAC domain-containing protein n=1 Tax=Erythroxylum novogranatense TaxID=1862640 RepID=A0AAV8U604_9ROSI|nr:hypothetical protein K2173_017149 [Erythroxylum novogranatense]
MAGPSWLVDGNRIATKIKSACDPGKVAWRSNPTKACPNCQHVIDNSDVTQDWPGLPKGVKFDPTDQEIIWHLLAKVGEGGQNPHPFIPEFIPTVEKDDGICYTHPRNLPGVKQDGSMSHFFHRAIKAYNTGTRKRRKIQGDDFGDVRWHKTGRTKPVILDGVQKGCKKIMVLYMSPARGGKAEKTNWVMHQYHLGTEEDERDGEYVISKIFYQQQQVNKGDKNEDEISENSDAMVAKVDPVTPNSVTPDPPRSDRRCPDSNLVKGPTTTNIYKDPFLQIADIEDEFLPEVEIPNNDDQPKSGNHCDLPECEILDNGDPPKTDTHCNQVAETNENSQEFPKWWDSQNLMDSQQLVEGLSLCDDLLQSQSPNRDGNDNERTDGKPRLSDYAKLGPENLKKDLEECQNLVLDPANIDLDTPPEFRLSQLDFGSQDSYISWGVKMPD